MLTPGHYLNQFSLSIDTMDSDALDDVFALLRDYFKNTMKSTYYSVFISGVRIETGEGPQPGLKKLWSSVEGEEMLPVFKAPGEFTGQMAYVYQRGRPVWITAPDEGKLADSSEFTDAWSHAEDLPPYRTPMDSADHRTSIIVPLRYGGRLFGCINLEFDDFHEFSSSGRDELLLVAEAVARIVWLFETAENASKSTRRALIDLELHFDDARSPLERPSIFVASPSRADEHCMKATLETINQYKDRFDIEFWQEMAASGNINQQVADAITSCHLGIFFLSARRDDDSDGDNGFAFGDNANVLFEAGMLFALKHQANSVPASWIVVRESEALGGPAPFDLASERMVIVPRDEDGNLLESDFQTALTEAIDSSLRAV